MKKIFFAFCVTIMSVYCTQAQQQRPLYPKSLMNQPGDHFMIQFGSLTWLDKPDSIRTAGFSRSFNAYFMFNFPFKSNPHFSVGLGLGVGSDNMFFGKTQPFINGTSAALAFPDKSNTTHFKSFKLVTSYIEAPVELRYMSNTNNINKAFKVSVGLKAGLLVSAHTKGTTEQNAANQTINDYTEKIKSSRYFNSTRFSGTVRIGYGPFSIFSTYQLSQFFKEGAGADVRPLTVGLTLSGL